MSIGVKFAPDMLCCFFNKVENISFHPTMKAAVCAYLSVLNVGCDAIILLLRMQCGQLSVA